MPRHLSDAPAGAGKSDSGWRTCPTCGERRWVYACYQDSWIGCSAYCTAVARQKLQPWNALQRRLLERMRSDRLTLKATGELIGVDRSTLRQWFKNSGQSLTSPKLRAVADFLGLEFDVALQQAGGKTGEQRMAETGRVNGHLAVRAAHRPSVWKKAAASNRGQRRTDEQRARMSTIARRNGNGSRGTPVLRDWLQSRDNRIRLRVALRLGRTPEPGTELVQRWTQAVADDVGLPVATIRALWRPVLIARGLVNGGGRPPREDRHALLAALMAGYPRSQSGRLRAGFWPYAAERIAEAEGHQLLTGEESGGALQDWWKKHQKACREVFPLSSEVVEAG